MSTDVGVRRFPGYGPGHWTVDADGWAVFLPLPEDWEAQALAGTPYRLGIVAGMEAWVTTVISPTTPPEPFLDLDGVPFLDLDGNTFTTLPG